VVVGQAERGAGDRVAALAQQSPQMLLADRGAGIDLALVGAEPRDPAPSQ